MATGDQGDMLARLKAVLPGRWFPDTTPVLDGLLSGLANTWASVYSLWAFVKLQTRIATATGAFLDIAALDFFGRNITRRVNESDPYFSARIRATILQPAVTRSAISQAVTTLTGRTPIIIEPWNNGDCGSWCDATGDTYGGNIAWDTAGVWGDLDVPYQFFVHAFRSNSGGISNIQGYYYGTGWAGGGYGGGAIEYTAPSQNPGQVADAEIYEMISALKLEGTTAWTAITN